MNKLYLLLAKARVLLNLQNNKLDKYKYSINYVVGL